MGVIQQHFLRKKTAFPFAGMAISYYICAVCKLDFANLKVMTENISHSGVITSIDGSHIIVRILQTTGCASCSAKGMCNSAESKEHDIDIIDNSGQWKVGDQVQVIGSTQMGLKAVLLAFVMPFLVLVGVLFLCIAGLGMEEVRGSGYALGATALYYLVLSRFKLVLKNKFAFHIEAE